MKKNYEKIMSLRNEYERLIKIAIRHLDDTFDLQLISKLCKILGEDSPFIEEIANKTHERMLDHLRKKEFNDFQTMVNSLKSNSYISFNVLDEKSPLIDDIVNETYNNMMDLLEEGNYIDFQNMVNLFKDRPNILGRIMVKNKQEYTSEKNILLTLLDRPQRDNIVEIFRVILEAVNSHDVLVELLDSCSYITNRSIVEIILYNFLPAELQDNICGEQLFSILYEAVKKYPVLLSTMVKQVNGSDLFLNENIVTQILDSKDEEAIQVFLYSKSVLQYLTENPECPVCQLLQDELQTRPNIFRCFVEQCKKIYPDNKAEKNVFYLRHNIKWKHYKSHFDISVKLNDVGWQRANTIFNMMRSEEDKIYLKDQLLKLINDISITSLTDKQLTQTLSNLIYKGTSKKLTFLYDHLVPKKYLDLKPKAQLLFHGVHRKTKIKLETGKDRQSQLQKVREAFDKATQNYDKGPLAGKDDKDRSNTGR